MTTSSNKAAETAKKAAGEYAATLIQDGMLIGLGTGSTAFFFIEALIRRCQEGLKISAIASSEKSRLQAKAGNIPLLEPSNVTELDIVVDGADEIDSKRRMIKGGGGALLREKIVAYMSHKRIFVVDESKCVPLLGKFPLPVEISCFAYQATIKALNVKGYSGTLRAVNQAPYITDNGNFIFDVVFKELIEDPQYHEKIISAIPGVLTTGFFFDLTDRVIVGCYDGSIREFFSEPNSRC